MNSETDSREILHNDHASKLVEPGEFIMQVQDAERKGKAFSKNQGAGNQA